MRNIRITQSQRGPCLKLTFSWDAINDNDNADEDMEEEEEEDDVVEESEHFNINNWAEVRFKCCIKDKIHVNYSMSWKRHESAPAALKHIQIIVSCTQLGYSRKFICGGNIWTAWKKIGTSSRTITGETLVMEPMKLTLIVSKMKDITFENLYEETDFCDFHLKTVHSGAGVPVHKACLSIHSDVLKRMFQGEWKENKTDCIEIDGVTLQNLEDFKKYIYLGILPNGGLLLRPLLLLAKCYMINNLLEECTRQLALTVKPEELYSLQEFAIDNKIPELIQAIVQITSDETVQIAYELVNEQATKMT